MSAHNVPIVELTIVDHPNADKLEVAIVGDYRVVVGKGEYCTGDWAVYIPSNSVLSPDFLARVHPTTRNYLSGAEKNRVKAQRIRGILSEGMLWCGYDFPIYEYELGFDCAELLGITKHAEQLPMTFRGKATGNAPTLRYDIENFKKYPDVFKDGEPVVFTEKLHGTWCCLGLHVEAGPIVTSKGLSNRGIALDVHDEQNKKDNIYVKMWHQHKKSVDRLFSTSVYVLGEIVGPGIQKGFDYGYDQPTFKMFDLHIDGRYVNILSEEWLYAAELFDTVPILFAGRFSKELMLQYTNGQSTVNGVDHIREGIVVKAVPERYADRDVAPNLGRAILKSVNEDYLLRKGKKTEYD